MAKYVDGFVVPVPTKKLDVYRKLARKAAKIWREHGALEYRECLGNDLNVKIAMPFPRGIKLKPGETIVFAWIMYRSRADRDRISARVAADPRWAKMLNPKELPFDLNRMLYGGFQVIVDANSLE